MICEILSQQNIKIKYNKNSKNAHYSQTPYEFNPKYGKKIIPNQFIDLGQGLLKLIEDIDHNLRDSKIKNRK